MSIRQMIEAYRVDGGPETSLSSVLWRGAGLGLQVLRQTGGINTVMCYTPHLDT